MLDNNISAMKPNLIGELNLILLNIPENLSPLERAWLIYNKAGHVFRYDYRIANNIDLAHKEIDFLTNNIDYFQTCTQISYLLNLMLNNIEGLESRVIKRNIQLRGGYKLYKVRNKWNGKEYFVVTEDNAKQITLKREDGKIFTIAKSELLFNYYTRNYEKVEN